MPRVGGELQPHAHRVTDTGGVDKAGLRCFADNVVRPNARVGDTRRVLAEGAATSRSATLRNSQPARRWTSALSSLICSQPSCSNASTNDDIGRPIEVHSPLLRRPLSHRLPPGTRPRRGRPPPGHSPVASPLGTRSTAPRTRHPINLLAHLLTGTGQRSRLPPGRIPVGKVRFQLRMCPMDAGPGGQVLTDAPEEVRQ
jgi:hypothetical protein